jgi:Uma2 family endonuclease
MTSVTTLSMPYGGPLTADELDAMFAHLPGGVPDDGRRYELLDGMLHVSGAPSWGHQEVAGAVYRMLHAVTPPHIRTMIAPFDVRLAPDTQFQPDVFVARYDDLRPERLSAAPLLAVEVRSPSTALYDLNLKRAAYERHGVASYWLVDPAVPSVTVLELRGGRYVDVGTVTGEQPIEMTVPFPVRLVPAELTRGLHPD